MRSSLFKGFLLSFMLLCANVVFAVEPDFELHTWSRTNDTISVEGRFYSNSTGNDIRMEVTYYDNVTLDYEDVGSVQESGTSQVLTVSESTQPAGGFSNADSIDIWVFERDTTVCPEENNTLTGSPSEILLHGYSDVVYVDESSADSQDDGGGKDEVTAYFTAHTNSAAGTLNLRVYYYDSTLCPADWVEFDSTQLSGAVTNIEQGWGVKQKWFQGAKRGVSGTTGYHNIKWELYAKDGMTETVLSTDTCDVPES